jgi:hypothetical protein
MLPNFYSNIRFRLVCNGFSMEYKIKFTPNFKDFVFGWNKQVAPYHGPNPWGLKVQLTTQINWNFQKPKDCD